VNELPMEIREVRESERLVIGVVAPYDETTYLAPDPAGERIRRNAFARSIAHRSGKIPLLDAHERRMIMGVSRSLEETPGGLIGTFRVNEGDIGDTFLANVRNGYYGGLSAGFLPLGNVERGPDGVREIREAKLVEVSAVGVPAYEGAGLLAVRNAQDLDALLAPFRARPDVNLSPLPPLAYRPR
jgi:Escherichia/Staphylococcus phage prohead protease